MAPTAASIKIFSRYEIPLKHFIFARAHMGRSIFLELKKIIRQ